MTIFDTRGLEVGTTAVDLGTYALQYASAAGTTWQMTTLSGLLLPSHYFSHPGGQRRQPDVTRRAGHGFHQPRLCEQNAL